MPLLRTWIPWNRLFLPALAERLTRGCAAAPWDLRDMLIVTPTRQAGRRLREALAVRAASAGTGVLAPRTVPPDWLAGHAVAADTAAPADVLAAWCHVLLDADLDEARNLFPEEPPRRDMAWAMGVAREFARVQAELASGNHACASAARRVASTDMEPERWNELAALEARWLDRLAQPGLASPHAAKADAAASAPPPAGLRRLVLAGVTELSAPSLAILGRWAGTLEIEIISHGEAGENLHDDWGRPLSETVNRRSLPLSHASCGLHVVRDARELADRVVTVAAGYRDAPGTLALGLADPALTPSVQQRLAKAGLESFDPAGIALRDTAPGRLATAFARLAQDDGVAALKPLLRSALVAGFAVDGQSWAATHAGLIAAFDDACAEHLPADLGELLACAPDAGLGALLRHLADVRTRLAEGPFFIRLTETLGELLAHRTLRLDDEEDARLADEAKLLNALLARHAEAEARHPDLDASFWPALLTAALADETVFPSHAPDARELNGWLELAYSDAPQLLIAGFNEGAVPETVRRDAFLPDALRRHLGLDSNDDRLARDRLMLESLLRSRQAGGRVDLLVPKLGADGDPRQPSRLLFACTDDELVPRALQLFTDLPPPPRSPARRVAWKLSPVAPAVREKFSASALKAYLACPFRYYLTHGLGMREVEADKQELNALEFGSLCHGALEALGRETALAGCADEAVLAGFLEEKLTALAAGQWGPAPSLAVRLQIEAARARLRSAAATEAGERAAGWRTVEVEHEWAFTRDDVTFRGRIDRIDRHADGRWRVLDYKTSDRAEDPVDTHLWTKQLDLPHVLPGSFVDVAGKRHRWVDLQLPLYVLAMRTLHPGVEVEAGYFCLPKTKEETAIKPWTGLTSDLLASAEACALAVAAAIRAQRFWPPNPKARARRGDTLERLFPDGPEADVDGDAMLALAAKGGSA